MEEFTINLYEVYSGILHKSSMKFVLFCEPTSYMLKKWPVNVWVSHMNDFLETVGELQGINCGYPSKKLNHCEVFLFGYAFPACSGKFIKI